MYILVQVHDKNWCSFVYLQSRDTRICWVYFVCSLTLQVSSINNLSIHCYFCPAFHNKQDFSKPIYQFRMFWALFCAHTELHFLLISKTWQHQFCNINTSKASQAWQTKGVVCFHKFIEKIVSWDIKKTLFGLSAKRQRQKFQFLSLPQLLPSF